MKAYIHIGDSKAGSTTIQRFLRDNRDELAKRNIDIADELSTNRAYHNRLAGAASAEISGRLANELSGETDLVNDVRRIVMSYSTDIVCSYEGFISMPVAAQLKQLLAQRFDQIAVICYLRRQDISFQSRFNQALFSGWTQDDVAARLRRDGPMLDYAARLAPWQAAFADMEIHSLERDRLDGGSLIMDFCQFLGIQTDGLAMPRAMNSSISELGRQVLLRINRDLESLPDDRLRAAVRDRVVAILRTYYGEKQMLFSRNEARELVARYEQSNEVLGVDFSQDFSMYSDQGRPQPEPERIARAVTNVIRIFRFE